MQVESNGWPKKAGTGNEEMRNEEMGNEDMRNGNRFAVYSTECAVGWQGKEGREVMAESSSSEAIVA